MNEHLKRLWVQALRSGDYQQGKGSLRHDADDVNDPDGFCCLGVLCDVMLHDDEGKKLLDPSDTGTTYGYKPPRWEGGTFTFYTDPDADDDGERECDGDLHPALLGAVGMTQKQQNFLVACNDGSWTTAAAEAARQNDETAESVEALARDYHLGVPFGVIADLIELMGGE